MLGDRRAGFAVDSYDASRPLIVDPIMTYGSFLGGSGGDYALALALDPRGNIYVTGSTNSPDFPVKAGLGYNYKSKYSVAFVAKIDPSVPAPLSLVYASYIGGTNEDHARAIAVDASGSAYITGTTFSADFPLSNAFQKPPSSALTYDGMCCD